MEDAGELPRPLGVVPRVAFDQAERGPVFAGDEVGLGDQQGRGAVVFAVIREHLLHPAGEVGPAGMGGEIGEQQQGGVVVLELAEIGLGVAFQPGPVAPLVVKVEKLDKRGWRQRVAREALDEG